MGRMSILLSAAILSTTASVAYSASWEIDPAHSSATFKVKHLLVSNVKGEIGGLKGTLDIDDKSIEKSKVLATLDASTISTGNSDRDKHLRSPDFFNVEKCKQIKFESKMVTGTPPNLKVTGPLTLNCVTKDVELTVEGPTAPVKGFKGELHRGVTASTSIERKDFNMTWNKNLDGGGVVVGDKVDISLELEVIGQEKPAH